MVGGGKVEEKLKGRGVVKIYRGLAGRGGQRSYSFFGAGKQGRGELTALNPWVGLYLLGPKVRTKRIQSKNHIWYTKHLFTGVCVTITYIDGYLIALTTVYNW